MSSSTDRDKSYTQPNAEAIPGVDLSSLLPNTLLPAILDTLTSGLLLLEIVRDENGQFSDLVYRQISRQVCEDSRMTYEQMINQPVRKVFPGIVQSLLWQKYAEVIRTGKPQRFEERYAYDGFDNFIDTAISPLGSSYLLVNYTINNDARRVVDAIRQEAVLFKVMSSNVPDVGTLVVSPDFRIVFANGDLPPELFVGSAADAPGQRLSDALHPDYRDEIMQYFTEAGRGVRRTLIQFFQENVFEVYVEAVAETSGQPVARMAIYRNITQTRRYQRELEQSVARLKHSNENLEHFAYIASHDLQEPLRKIQSFGEVLTDQYAPQLGVDGQDLVRRMQSASTRMAALIRDLLVFSRLTTRQTDHQTVDLNDCLAQALSDLELTIRSTGAAIEADLLPVVPGDSQQLCRLFQNLLSNALKFMPPGKTPRIRIASRMVKARDINPRLSEPSRIFHEISVGDNGIGFDEKYLDRIFVIFQRLHGKQNYAGTGLGLAICKKIVDIHQGYITASSQPGQGATFRVCLPALPQ